MLQVSELLGVARGGGSGAAGLARRAPHRFAPAGAAPPVVVWNVCAHCNMGCPHCYAAASRAPSPHTLSTGEGRALLAQLAEAGVRVVIFSGGEPLLRPDLLDLIQCATRLRLAAHLSTNGAVITREVALRLRDAGVEYVGISIDGTAAFNDAYRDFPNGYALACAGLVHAKAAGLRTGWRMTLTRRNAAQWREAFASAAALGVDRFYLSHLLYSGRGKRLEGDDLSPAEARALLLEVFAATDEAVRRGEGPAVVTGGNDSDGPLLLGWVATHYGAPASTRVRRLLEQRGGNSAGEKLLCIDHRGRVFPDQFWRTACLGDLRAQVFSDVLAHPLRAELADRERRLQGRCGRCRFLSVCRGSHRERALAWSGEVWASDPACVMTDAEVGEAVETVSRRGFCLGGLLGVAALSCSAVRQELPVAAGADESGLAGRVFVVEREAGRLAVYDYLQRRLLPVTISGLGDLRHATMAFSLDLQYGYVATRSGLLTRIDVAKVARAGDVQVSASSIDIAVTQDGRYIATAEYQPGGVTVLDARSLAIVKRIDATVNRDGQALRSRVTGLVDAPGNLLVCVLIEGTEIWVIDAGAPGFPIVRRVPTRTDLPYDAMITPDGHFYVVGHMGSEHVTVLDLRDPQSAPREVSLRDPERTFERGTPVKLPHMASWAVAGGKVFVPLVGEKRLAVLDGRTWAFARSLAVKGHPVYAVASPTQAEVWVSFSGEDDDAYVQVIDAERLEVTRTLRLGRRIYHMEFTPRGAYLLASANADNKLVLVDTRRYAVVDEQTIPSPSGIFGCWRAFRIGL